MSFIYFSEQEKQAANEADIGRLIRSESDTGLVSILDTRTLNGAYKNRLNKVLSKYPRVETIEGIEDFFKAVKPGTYFSEVENDC